MILTSVDLPAPLSPMRPTISPASIVSETPSRGADRTEMARDVAQF